MTECDNENQAFFKCIGSKDWIHSANLQLLIMNPQEENARQALQDQCLIVDKVLHLDQLTMSSWGNDKKGKFGIAGGDEIQSWKAKLLRFCDQMPAICYATGISFAELTDAFPEIFSLAWHYDNVKGKDWPQFDDLVNSVEIPPEISKEMFSIENWTDIKIKKNYHEGHFNQYSTGITSLDQIDFIKKNKSRNPKKVLDVGGGRGELAHVLHQLSIECDSIEPGLNAEFLYDVTGKLFFDVDASTIKPLSTSFGEYLNTTDLSKLDTIIFCQSIEHLPETDFWNFWNQVREKFKGFIIITNWLYYHPIRVDGVEHIFEINDAVYDRLVAESKQCIYRNNSHLVLEL